MRGTNCSSYEGQSKGAGVGVGVGVDSLEATGDVADAGVMSAPEDVEPEPASALSAGGRGDGPRRALAGTASESSAQLAVSQAALVSSKRPGDLAPHAKNNTQSPAATTSIRRERTASDPS
jgi:hypothetical protein